MKKAAKKKPLTKSAKKKSSGVARQDVAVPTTPVETVLVLRCVNADMSSSHAFVWPGVGETAIAPDWDPIAECGFGLHGWLWGEGDPSAAGSVPDNESARWLVVEVVKDDIVSLGGKVKFPRGKVLLVGERIEATTYIAEHGGAGRAILWGTATAGYAGTATAGYAGTATAGDRGTATAGDRGTATAGDRGTATAGYAGTATAGDRGTATAGEKGTIVIRYWCPKLDRYRTVFGEVGIDGIEAGVAYVLTEGKLTRKATS